MDAATSGWGLALALLDNWSYGLLLLIVWAGMAGRLGKGVGLSNIFRDDASLIAARRSRSYIAVLWSSPAFWTHAALVLVTGLIWVTVLEWPTIPGACPRYAIWPASGCDGRVGVVALLVVAAASGGIGLLASWSDARALRVDGTPPPPTEVAAEITRAAIGVAIGLAALFALWRLVGTAPGWPFWALRTAVAGWPAHVLGIVAPDWAGDAGAWLGGWVDRNWTAPILWFWLAASLFLIIALASPKVLACLSLMGLIVGVVIVSGLFDRIQNGLAEALVLILVLLVVVFNGARFKHRIPGFPDKLYDEKTKADPTRPGALPGHPGAIAPTDALDAWLARAREGRGAGFKPKLALLATSGGAYRASFWTALALDRLADESGPGQRLEGLINDIRLVTGASGGMVAGACFVAMAAEGAPPGGVRLRLEEDVETFQRSDAGGRRTIPIPRDSLTPIAQRMVRGDLPRILWPGVVGNDRGRVLDSQWKTLDITFADIAKAEADGRAPSLILSPMLIESGAPAFISNLDLGELRRRTLARADDDVNRESVEIFDAFPDAWPELTLATAVRLNATFPYVSPAISLPTIPQRRVVDAGYYDNYGMDLATAYLLTPSIRAWIAEHCAGVAVLQLRAFPSGRADEAKSGAARAFQWLTSPAEGVFSARGSSQMFRNNQQMRLVESIYAKDVAAGFVRSFEFEADVEASMSWYLPQDELDAMARLLPLAPDRAGPDAGAGAGATAAETRSAIEREFDALVAFWNA